MRRMDGTRSANKPNVIHARELNTAQMIAGTAPYRNAMVRKIHGKISFFAAGHGEMSSLQHLGFSGCCGNATRKGEQRAARNPPFRYKNSGTRHFWQAPLGLIRILHPNHITGSIRCHLNPYQSVAGRCCSLAFVLLRCWSFLFIARHYAPCETVLHRPSPCETICIDF